MTREERVLARLENLVAYYDSRQGGYLILYPPNQTVWQNKYAVIDNGEVHKWVFANHRERACWRIIKGKFANLVKLSVAFK